MASVYVTQSGAGLEDGTSLENAIAIGDLLLGHWNTPAHSSDGAERIYFYGTLTTRLSPLGAGGTSDTERLWVDCTNAIFEVTGTVQAAAFSSKSYMNIVGGTYIGTSGNTTTVFDFFGAQYCKLLGGTITATSSSPNGIRFWATTTTDIEGNTVDGTTVTMATDEYNAIQFSHNSGTGNTAVFRNNTIRNCTLNAKIVVLYADHEDMIFTDGRFCEGMVFENNTFRDTPVNSIQLICTAPYPAPTSYVRGNKFYDCGYLGTLVNVIQIGYCRNLIIEDNELYNPLNTGGTGDGNAIIIDWESERGAYSDGVVVRNNYIEEAVAVTGSAGIAVWAAKNTEIYGNVVTTSVNGIKMSDAIRGLDYDFFGWTSGNPTLALCTLEDVNRWPFAGDTITISGVTINSGTDINGTHTVLSSTGSFISIDFDSTGASYLGGSFTLNRGTGNRAYNNTLIDCDNGGTSRYGIQDTEWYNNIFINCGNGLYSDDQWSGLAATEQYNIFYNNTENFIYETTPQTIDSTSQEINPLLSNSGIPSSESPCYHAGTVVSFSTKDKKGHKFNVPPTIGAYEFTSRSEAKTGRYR